MSKRSRRTYSSRWTFSRAFKRLSQAGAVEARGRRILIKDHTLLERAAGLR